LDCYRDVLANTKAWRNNPHRGRRPRVKKLSMLLHHGSGYRIEDGYVEIMEGSGSGSLGGIGGTTSTRVERLGLSIKRGR